jgi:hypothetical protein
MVEMTAFNVPGRLQRWQWVNYFEERDMNY